MVHQPLPLQEIIAIKLLWQGYLERPDQVPAISRLIRRVVDRRRLEEEEASRQRAEAWHQMINNEFPNLLEW